MMVSLWIAQDLHIKKQSFIRKLLAIPLGQSE